MATLSGAITADQTVIRVSGSAVPGDYFTIGSEAIRFLGTSRGVEGRAYLRSYWSVDRGVAGTTAAAHADGASLTQYYPDAAGSGSGGVSVDNTVDPPATVTTLVALGAVITGDSATLLIPQLIGPFRVIYSDVDPVPNFDLGLLINGTIIWRISVFCREEFSATNERIQVQLGTIAGFGQKIIHDVKVTGPQAHAGLESDVAVVESAVNNLYGDDTGLIGIAQHGAHLLAADLVGSNTAGIVDIYALISVPAS